MDQRGTLRRMLAAVDREGLPDSKLVAMKRDMMRPSPSSASFLLDPTFGLPAARDVEDVPPTACSSRPSRARALRTTVSPP